MIAQIIGSLGGLASTYLDSSLLPTDLASGDFHLGLSFRFLHGSLAVNIARSKAAE